jgi:hypothetical protein
MDSDTNHQAHRNQHSQTAQARTGDYDVDVKTDGAF